MRLGNAPSPRGGIPILQVDSQHQAHGKLTTEDVIIAINGYDCIGMTSQEAVKIIVKNEKVYFMVKHTPRYELFEPQDINVVSSGNLYSGYAVPAAVQPVVYA